MTSTLSDPPTDLCDGDMELIIKLLSDLRHGKLTTSTAVALATLTLLEQVINSADNASEYALCLRAGALCRVLQRAAPRHPSAAHTARRVLRVLRHQHHHGSEAGCSSLQRLVRGAPRRATSAGLPSADLLREQLCELRLELETSGEAVLGVLQEHLAPHELMLAVPGTGTESQGAEFGQLSVGGRLVARVPPDAVAAVMARVDKVWLESAVGLGDGSCLVPAGARAVAAVASLHAVPVLVKCPLHQLAPPRSALAGCASSIPGLGGMPQWELLPADLVSLYITNLGGSSPSYMYRLQAELYDPRDLDLGDLSHTQ